VSTTRSQLYRFARDLGNVEAVEHGYKRGGLSGAASGGAQREARRVILQRFGVSLGAGLGALVGQALRIGHLGDFNDAMLIGALGAVELGLGGLGLSVEGGVAAAMRSLS